MASNIPFSSTSVKAILEKYGIKPQKNLGQNFLVNPRILQKIVGAAQLNHTDTIVEVGPGLGILTEALAKEVKQVIAVEKDQKMVGILREILDGVKNIEIICGDILDTRLRPSTSFGASAWQANYKVVANLPYYITSPVIRKFLEADRRPELMVLMVQKEVAQRICAKPPHMNLLAVSVQFYGKPEIVSYVKKTSFWPRPNVDSAILRINIRPERERGATIFFKIVKAGFKQPRKQLLNNFYQELKINKGAIEQWLKQNSLSPTARAETLSIKEWEKLAQTFQTL